MVLKEQIDLFQRVEDDIRIFPFDKEFLMQMVIP